MIIISIDTNAALRHSHFEIEHFRQFIRSFQPSADQRREFETNSIKSDTMLPLLNRWPLHNFNQSRRRENTCTIRCVLLLLLSSVRANTTILPVRANAQQQHVLCSRIITTSRVTAISGACKPTTTLGLSEARFASYHHEHTKTHSHSAVINSNVNRQWLTLYSPFVRSSLIAHLLRFGVQIELNAEIEHDDYERNCFDWLRSP